jgi:hypothetical protein
VTDTGHDHAYGFSCYFAVGGDAGTLDALHAEWSALPVWADRCHGSRRQRSCHGDYGR